MCHWGCMDLSTPLRLESTFTIGGSQSCYVPMHSMPSLQFLSGSQRLKIPGHYCTTRDLLESLVIGMIQNEMATMSQLLTTTTYQIKYAQERASRPLTLRALLHARSGPQAADPSHSFSLLPLGPGASGKW